MPLARSSAHAAFAAASRSTLADLSTGGQFDLFLVARATDRWWTPLTAVRATDALPVHLGTHFPVETTACHRLLVDRRPVVSRDLHRHGDPQVRVSSRAHHVAGYAGAAIRRPDGRLLGTLCAFSASRFEGDVDPIAARLHEGADRLARDLGTALDVVADERRASYDHALRSSDAATRLPDRRGWGLMLRDEGERSRDLAQDAAVVLVDTGLVRTTRGVRRAADVVRDVVGDLPVSRVNGRQFGLLLAGDDDLDPGTTAGDVQDALRTAGYSATSGWAAREPAGGMADTWLRAEDALIGVRSQPGRSRLGA
ncbi:hypothetical protein SAMN05660199_01292 [Klenkia soli]|uniref:GAF domain-containing protein n=1 Tax=Klenkia soli TaxID=1052260 RepID=A0A1H0GMX5_9ACTN|nr:GAF domain-containing protein [Klenkia soli]SDO08263.1 hypothetical protein SAMN05660199_01292 [Klenkia soli]